MKIILLMDDMDVELTPLLHEDPSSSENADSKSKKWPELTDVHRFRIEVH